MLVQPISPDEAKQEINVIPMNFRRDYKPVKGNPDELREVHAVDLVKKGSHGESTPWSISELQKNEELWRYVKPYYDRWLEGQEDPTDGTPIDVLPFVPKGLVDHLRALNIRSAEDLAGLTENDLNRVGMGARRLKEKAVAYVEAMQGDAKFAERVADLSSENENLRAEIEDLKKMVNELTPKEKRKAK